MTWVRLGGNPPEPPGLEVLKRLDQLLAGVHDEGAVGRNGLADGPPPSR